MKLFRKCFALLLALCLLVNVGITLGNETKEAQATTTGPYLDSFMAHYFYDLQENYPRNKHGTCGYVAIGMVLSYYDNYLNANIVPEKYEAHTAISDGDFVNTGKSPGLRRAIDGGENCQVRVADDVRYTILDMTSEENYYRSMLETVSNNVDNDDLLQAKLFEISQNNDIFSSFWWNIYC